MLRHWFSDLGATTIAIAPSLSQPIPNGPADPFETAGDGMPLRWTNPSNITIATLTYNYASDQGVAPVDSPLTAQEQSLMRSAAEVWEALANVHFSFVTDMPAGLGEPDIRVGIADLRQSMHPNTMGFIGYTEYHWRNDVFLPDTVVTVSSQPTTQLADGDLQYTGFTSTMFQDFLHEIGHALGLGHNAPDRSAIMNPILSTANRVPDAQDVTAIRALYGAPSSAPALSAADASVLHNLLGGTSLATVA